MTAASAEARRFRAAEVGKTHVTLPAPDAEKECGFDAP
jgi:hypothetical protein